MKSIYLFALLFFSTILVSQAPQFINYQGVARSATGAPLPGTNVTLTISIVNSSGSYSETHNVTTNSLGLFTLLIGNGIATSSTFSSINWSSAPTTLALTINAGSGPVNLPSQQLVSVPYALYAEKAASAPSPTINFSAGVLTVGSNSVAIPAGSNYTAGTGISISSGSVISNTLPDITPTLTGVGIATVTQSGSSYTIAAATPTLIGAGTTTVTGTYPTFFINSGASTGTSVAGVSAITAGTGLAGSPTNTITTTGTLSLAPSGVTAGSYGTPPNSIPQFTVDAYGRLTNAGSYVYTPTVLLSGDAKGPAGTNTVVAIQNQSVSAVTPTVGQILAFNGTVWAPFTPTAAGGPWFKPSANNVALTTSSDNVGIGTNAPSSRLDVVETGTTTGLSVSHSSTGNYVGSIFTSNTSVYTARITNDGTGAPLAVYKPAAAAAGNAAQFSILGTTNNSDVATFSTNGNGRAIYAQNTSSTQTSLFVNTGTGYAVHAENLSPGAAQRAAYLNGGVDVRGKTSTAGDFAILTTNSIGTNLFNVRNDGNVGINVPNPGYKLAVLENAGTLPAIFASNTSASNSGSAHGVYGLTGNPNNLAAGVYGENTGPGPAVAGLKNTGAAGIAGRFETQNTSGNSPAVFGLTNGTGPGVYAASGAASTATLALQIDNGHVKSTGAAVTSGTVSVVGGFISPLTTTCAGCTDVKGTVSFSVGISGPGVATGEYFILKVPYSKSYSSQPVVVVTMMSDLGKLSYFVSASLTSEFQIKFINNSGSNVFGPASGKFNYYIIE